MYGTFTEPKVHRRIRKGPALQFRQQYIQNRAEPHGGTAPYKPVLLDIPDALFVGSVKLSAVDSRDPPASTSLVLGLFTLQRLLSVPHGWAAQCHSWATEGTSTVCIAVLLNGCRMARRILEHDARENTLERGDS